MLKRVKIQVGNTTISVTPMETKSRSKKDQDKAHREAVRQRGVRARAHQTAKKMRPVK